MTFEEEVLQQLISIPSPSGNEKEIGEFIYTLLGKHGFKVRKVFVDKDRFNIVVKYGKPKVYLAAHIDTVKPHIDYSDNSTYIFGRGACDTKASVAAMLSTALGAKKLGIKAYGLIFTVGEETTLDGVQAIVKSGLDIPFVVVGEPTSLQIVNGHFGYLVIKLIAKGKAAHSCKPEKGINAINLLLDAIQKLKTLTVHPETLMSLVQIEGGIAENIIPDSANATLSFRISPKDNIDYPKVIKSLLPVQVTLQVIQHVGAVYFNVPKQLGFIKIRKTVKYLSELSFYRNGVVIGPGDIQYAHGLNEKVKRSELAVAVKIYHQILQNYSRS